MQRKCDVLVTYCWNRVGYNILRSLSLHGLKVWAADTSKKNICSLSKFCAGSFVYPDPFTEENAFVECLLAKVEELKPQVLLPTHDESVVIMRHRERFPKELIIPYEGEQLLLDLANIGLGIAFIPDYLITEERPDIYPLKLKEALPEREIVIVTSDPMPLSPAAREFIKFFQEN